MREIYRKKPWWQPARIDFGFIVRAEIVELSRIARGAMSLCVDFMLADRGVSVVRGGEVIRGCAQGWIGVHIVVMLFQIGVGVRHPGFRCWAIDSGLQPVQAITLIVLRSVGLA